MLIAVIHNLYDKDSNISYFLHSDIMINAEFYIVEIHYNFFKRFRFLQLFKGITSLTHRALKDLFKNLSS